LIINFETSTYFNTKCSSGIWNINIF
jgi:hypothetical protein